MLHLVPSVNTKLQRTHLKTCNWLLDVHFKENAIVIDVSAGGTHHQGFVLLSFPIT